MAEQLSATEELQLGLSRALYGVARVLRLGKLRDLLSSALLGPDATVYLLGRRYCCPPHATEAQQEEALARMLLHFHSIPWMTYRTGFTPIAVGDVQLRSDAGWGCTLRSGQMILAVGLQRHLLGAHWRWPQPPEPHSTGAAASGTAGASEAPPELGRLLQLFWDTPAERNPFSLHKLCVHGRRAGVVPGRWLGPWVMCRALEAAVAAAQAHHDLGVTVAVLADSGGGAPLLVATRFEAAFAGGSGSGVSGGKQAEQQQQDTQQNGSSAAMATAAPAAGAGPPDAAAAAAEAQPELVPVDSCTLAVEAPSPAAALAASTGHLSLKGGGTAGSRGLILLVPLTLGIGKLNPRYAPQLEAVLTWPQSIGIVGGRPSSSLYFVGCQVGATAAGAAGAAGAAAAAAGAAAGDPNPPGAAQHAGGSGGSSSSGGGVADGPAGAAGCSGSVIYLDPHQVQEAACCDADWLSFRCEAPRSMPTASIDPSLALGFYCGSLDEYRDLCSRLAALERQSGGAPLVCVTTAEAAAAAAAYDSTRASEWEPDEMSSEELSETEPASGEEEDAEDEAAAAAEDEAAAAEAVAAAQAEAVARQRQLEEEPELLSAPSGVLGGSAAAQPPAAAAAAAAAGSPRSPPSLQGPQHAAAGTAASSPRQPSLTPRHSRGWELL